jgi:hypothetical protein
MKHKKNLMKSAKARVTGTTTSDSADKGRSIIRVNVHDGIW